MSIRLIEFDKLVLSHLNWKENPKPHCFKVYRNFHNAGPPVTWIWKMGSHLWKNLKEQTARSRLQQSLGKEIIAIICSRRHCGGSSRLHQTLYKGIWSGKSQCLV